MHLYRDLERFKSSWLAISPEDRDAVVDLYGNIKKLHSFEVPTQKPKDMMNVFEKIRMMLAMKEAGSVI